MFGFGFGKGGGFDALLAQARSDKDAKVIDVRSPKEFASGHVKGALNIPVDRIDQVRSLVPDPSTPLYLYCTSGMRSAGAVRALRGSGYTEVVNMGGIMDYSGEMV